MEADHEAALKLSQLEGKLSQRAVLEVTKTEIVSSFRQNMATADRK